MQFGLFFAVENATSADRDEQQFFRLEHHLAVRKQGEIVALPVAGGFDMVTP